MQSKGKINTQSLGLLMQQQTGQVPRIPAVRLFKLKRKVEDPVRFPRVINGYEGLFKKNFQIQLVKLTTEVAKTLSKLV